DEDDDEKRAAHRTIRPEHHPLRNRARWNHSCGGYSANCGSSSRIGCHDAFDATKMCACGAIAGSSSRVATAIHTASGSPSKRKKRFEPQTPQNARSTCFDE